MQHSNTGVADGRRSRDLANSPSPGQTAAEKVVAAGGSILGAAGAAKGPGLSLRTLQELCDAFSVDGFESLQVCALPTHCALRC
jgi:hypothetical protein